KFKAEIAFFAGMAVFVFARSLMPGLGEMLIAATTASAVRDENALTWRGQIGKRLVGLAVVNHRADRDLQNHVRAGVAGSIRTFPVTAAVGFKFAIVTIAEKRVVVRIGFKIDAPSVAAIAAARAAARDIFFAAERNATVAAVAGFHKNFRFVYEHR